MVDLPDVTGVAGATSLQCDRAIFTSLPSPTGEGYRLVAWSPGLRPEERAELTRRAPSHGSMGDEEEGSRALVQFRLASSGRVAWGFVRLSGAEHTRRGGGRVWTDFLLADAVAAGRAGHHPGQLRAALEAAPPLSKPVEGTSLPTARVVPVVSGVAADLGNARTPQAVAMAASVAAMLLQARSCVLAVGPAVLEVLDDALRMIPGAARAYVDACAGLRFSPTRGVKATLIRGLDPEVVRATRGRGTDCLDLTKQSPVVGEMAPWLALMSRWWNQGRSEEAIDLAQRLAGDWTKEGVLEVAALCEAIDRGERGPEALEALVSGR